MIRRLTVISLALACLAVAATPALAAKGGKVKTTQTVGSCSTATPGLVVPEGLPTGEVINFLIHDATGTTGWVLGFSDDGNWTVSVPPANGPTTYEFVSRIQDKAGTRYTVFASCTA